MEDGNPRPLTISFDTAPELRERLDNHLRNEFPDLWFRMRSRWIIEAIREKLQREDA